jgi:homoserine O-acetyltransferase/O-succinyltransferase
MKFHFRFEAGKTMRRLIVLLFVCQVLLAQNPANAPAPGPERHEFVIANFHTELGATLPEAHIVYGTYGHLNAARDNAVLLPSHYMANLRGYEWLIGQDRALDASKLFLVTTELFGNGRSSSPGAVSRSALSYHDHSRQCRSGASIAHAGT